ncbi:MAG: type II secretion system F family protein [Gammaproteobacteria bacterium]|jgi:tight adherence protein C
MQLNLETGILALFFLAATLFVVGLYAAFRPDGVRRRMMAAVATTPEQAASLRFRYDDDGFVRVLKRLEKFGAKGNSEDSSVRLSLIRAGYYDPKAVPIYFGTRIFVALALAIAVVIIFPIVNATKSNLPIGLLPMFAILAGAVGYLLPALYLSRRTRNRKLSIQEGFPDAIDMMLVCVEAGLGLAAAIERVGTELAKANAVLAENFKLVGIETRAGKSREEALRNLVLRTGVEDVSSFVTMLIQTQELGASMAETLRVYAFEMRNRRMLRAEEKANLLPVKIVFPLAFCILPCLWIVIFTPLVIKIVRGFAAVS